MKASRFSEAQKAFILKQGADGMPVADICRKAGVSQATYFNWKKRYDGLLLQCCVAASGTTTPRAWTHAHAVALGRSQYARAFSVPVFTYREVVFRSQRKQKRKMSRV
jgi:AcrR family transcriptional regulator